MNRKQFIAQLAAWPLVTKASSIRDLHQEIVTPLMPALFLGHRSPMNAIEENEFVQGFRHLATDLPKPKAILCISAHWETRGTLVTAMSHPRTIHDFGGFPQALYQVQYPAPGSPELANETRELIKKTQVKDDHQWGLDHGAWSVIKHLYPKADVPVIQMSLDYSKPPQYHYELARELAALRRKGVLIVGSGNMVHNLRLVAWDRLNEVDYAFDWATEASDKMKTAIRSGDHHPLVNFQTQGRSFDLAIPTPEHFLPLLYVLALQEKDEASSFFNDKAVAGALTMTSVKVDKA